MIAMLSSWPLGALLLLGLAGCLLLLRLPAAGLVLLVVGSLVVPLAVATGTHTDVPFTLLCVPPLLGLWLLRMLFRRDWSIFFSRPARPLLAFVATAIISFALANQPWWYIAPVAPLPAQLGGLAVFVLSAGVFLMTADQLREARAIQVLTWVFLGIGAWYLAGRLVPVWEPWTTARFPRGADGSLFWTWLVALAFAQAAFNERLPVVVRVAVGGVVLAAFFVALTQARDWLSGWAPPLVTVVACLWAAAPRVALPVTVAGGLVAALNIPSVIAVVASPDNRYSLMTRVEAWRVLGRILAMSPAFGFGPANYYHVTSLLPILGFYVRFSSHNTYADIIAQTGLIGFAFFAWFVWEVARLGWRLRADATPGFPRAYVIGAVGGLAGTLAAGMLGDWLLPFVYNVTLQGVRASVLGWVFLGALVALDRITHRERPDP